MLVISLIIIWNFFVSSIVKVTPAFYLNVHLLPVMA